MAVLVEAPAAALPVKEMEILQQRLLVKEMMREQTMVLLVPAAAVVRERSAVML
jgi:hypothetical protein